MAESETLKRARKVKLLRDDSKRLRYLSKEECQSTLNGTLRAEEERLSHANYTKTIQFGIKASSKELAVNA